VWGTHLQVLAAKHCAQGGALPSSYVCCAGCHLCCSLHTWISCAPCLQCGFFVKVRAWVPISDRNFHAAVLLYAQDRMTSKHVKNKSLRRDGLGVFMIHWKMRVVLSCFPLTSCLERIANAHMPNLSKSCGSSQAGSGHKVWDQSWRDVKRSNKLAVKSCAFGRLDHGYRNCGKPHWEQPWNCWTQLAMPNNANISRKIQVLSGSCWPLVS